MTLLVVTPTLGRSPWLDLTIASVQAHAAGAHHVLVTPAPLVSELANRFPTTQVVAEPGSGLYRAVNAGTRVFAQWDVLTYLNDDDQLEAGFASVRAAATPQNDIVYGDVRYVDDRGHDLGRMPIAQPAWVATLLHDGSAPFTQQGTTISRAAWTQLGGFDEQRRYAADYDFWCRAAASGLAFARVRQTVASFRLHGRQLSANQEAMRTELAAIRVHYADALASRRRTGARLWFRCCSLTRLWERRRRAGVWTSAALYARFSRTA